VPRGCVRIYQGGLVAQCTLDHLAPGGLVVREFLTSRYDRVHAEGAALRVDSHAAGTLYVVLDGNSAMFTAIGREVPLAVDTSPPQG